MYACLQTMLFRMKTSNKIKTVIFVRSVVYSNLGEDRGGGGWGGG